MSIRPKLDMFYIVFANMEFKKLETIELEEFEEEEEQEDEESEWWDENEENYENDENEEWEESVEERLKRLEEENEQLKKAKEKLIFKKKKAIEKRSNWWVWEEELKLKFDNWMKETQKRTQFESNNPWLDYDVVSAVAEKKWVDLEDAVAYIRSWWSYVIGTDKIPDPKQKDQELKERLSKGLWL